MGGWGAQVNGSRAPRTPARPHLDVEVGRIEAARRDEPSLGGPQVLRHQLAGSLHQKLAVALGGHDAARARRTSGRRPGPRGRYYAGAGRTERFRVCGRPPRLRLAGPRAGSSPGASRSPRPRSSGSLSAGSGRNPRAPEEPARSQPGRPQDAGKAGVGPGRCQEPLGRGSPAEWTLPKVCAGCGPAVPAAIGLLVRTFRSATCHCRRAFILWFLPLAFLELLQRERFASAWLRAGSY